MLVFKILLLFLVVVCAVKVNVSKKRTPIRFKTPQDWRRRLLIESRKSDYICYGDLGCFNSARKRPLSRLPESPDAIDTKFYLFRRDLNFSSPQLLRYQDNGSSLNGSNFDPRVPIKVIIHGYTNRWNERGALESVAYYLKIYDCNVLVMDWEKGAVGPKYANAVANTEIVGRELGLLLLRMVEMGTKTKDIHLVGFSLGAHVAGCASEILKQRGYLIGRITGLDTSSPLFRYNHIREKSKKLDKSDAVFVDGIHTDASPFFTEGFGLLEPYAHVDFFPNGGFEQPGCSDGMASILLTHLEGTITKDVVCSHLRAWKLFLETLKMKSENDSRCEFIAYKCKGGLESFQTGDCFPLVGTSDDALALDPSYRTELGRLGEDVAGEGVMYLNTKGNFPYCGKQLQASVILSDKSEYLRGSLNLIIRHDNSTTNFVLTSQNYNFIKHRREINRLGITDADKLHSSTSVIPALIVYIPEVPDNKRRLSDIPSEIFLDKVTVRDMFGHKWQHCNQLLLKKSFPTSINLSKNLC